MNTNKLNYYKERVKKESNEKGKKKENTQNSSFSLLQGSKTHILLIQQFSLFLRLYSIRTPEKKIFTCAHSGFVLSSPEVFQNLAQDSIF